MTSGNWSNKDGLYLQFGTSKATSENWGDFVMPGGNRQIEGLIDLSTLGTSSTSPTILSYNTFFVPAGSTGGANSNSWFVEKVEAIAETAMSTASSPTLNVGLVAVGTIPPTSASTTYPTAFIATAAASTLSQGALLTFTNGSTAAGTVIGTTNPAASTGPYYLAAYSGTATSTGKIRVRINYHGIGTITQ